MFTRDRPHRDSEEKKDVFAPVADLMVGVVFIFILMVLALSLVVATQKTIPADRFNKIAELAKQLSGARAITFLKEAAKADQQRTMILEKIRVNLKNYNINVEIDKSNGTLRLPSSKLFEPTHATPTAEGRAVIQRIGSALAEIIPCYLANAKISKNCPQKEEGNYLSAVYIEGHTDVEPLNKVVDRFRNNWDLSAARAIEAHQIILQSDPKIEGLRTPEGKSLIGVSGYAETRPVDESLTLEQRRGELVKEADRRIEIRLIMSVDSKVLNQNIIQIDDKINELNKEIEKIRAELR
jgi:flagellar motor protein MotB